MRAARFMAWAVSRGGLGSAAADSHVSELTAVEGDYAVNLDAAPLADVLARLDADRTLTATTKKNRLSAVRKYARFLTATAA